MYIRHVAPILPAVNAAECRHPLRNLVDPQREHHAADQVYQQVASEVVREGLRMLEQREEEEKAKLAWLRGAIQEGVDAAERGEYTTLPTAGAVSDFLHGLRAK